MFEASTYWVDGFIQVSFYALVTGLILWLLSKIEIKEGKDNK